MARIFKLDRNFDDTVADRKTADQHDLIADFWYAARKQNKQQTIKEDKRK